MQSGDPGFDDSDVDAIGGSWFRRVRVLLLFCFLLSVQSGDPGTDGGGAAAIQPWAC